jgi:hypothetical protein
MITPFSHKETHNTKRPLPCVGFDALSQAMDAWVQDLTHPKRLLVVSDSLVVQRLAEEGQSQSEWTSLSGNESPATRKQRTRLWLQSPTMKLILSPPEARRLFKAHPEAKSLTWDFSPLSHGPLQSKCTPLLFLFTPLLLQLKKRLLKGDPTLRVIWIVDGLPPHERPHVESLPEAQTAWQDAMTLEQLHALEKAFQIGTVRLLCVDVYSLQALRLPTQTVDGQTLRVHALYESKHPCRRWPEVAGLFAWASFTRHPHEWWRWW